MNFKPYSLYKKMDILDKRKFQLDAEAVDAFLKRLTPDQMVEFKKFIELIYKRYYEKYSSDYAYAPHFIGEAEEFILKLFFRLRGFSLTIRTGEYLKKEYSLRDIDFRE